MSMIFIYSQAVLNELVEAVPIIPEFENSIHTRLAPYMFDGVLTTTDLPEALMDEVKVLLDVEQLKKLERLRIIKDSVEAFCLKQDEQRAFQLLTAAGKGDVEVRQRSSVLNVWIIGM